MSVYSPFNYILESKIDFYSELYDDKVNDKGTLKQKNRENNLKILMRVNFLKRLESSVDSFRITLNNFATNISNILEKIEDFEVGKETLIEDENIIELENMEDETWLDEEFSIGKKVKINLRDMNTIGWKEDLEDDLKTALHILEDMKKVTALNDKKLKDQQKAFEEEQLKI